MWINGAIGPGRWGSAWACLPLFRLGLSDPTPQEVIKSPRDRIGLLPEVTGLVIDVDDENIRRSCRGEVSRFDGGGAWGRNIIVCLCPVDVDRTALQLRRKRAAVAVQVCVCVPLNVFCLKSQGC